MQTRQSMIEYIMQEEGDIGYWLEKSSLVHEAYWGAVSEYLSGLDNKELKAEYQRIQKGEN